MPSNAKLGRTQTNSDYVVSSPFSDFSLAWVIGIARIGLGVDVGSEGPDGAGSSTFLRGANPSLGPAEQ